MNHRVKTEALGDAAERPTAPTTVDLCRECLREGSLYDGFAQWRLDRLFDRVFHLRRLS